MCSRSLSGVRIPQMLNEPRATDRCFLQLAPVALSLNNYWHCKKRCLGMLMILILDHAESLIELQLQQLLFNSDELNWDNPTWNKRANKHGDEPRAQWRQTS